MGPKIMLANSLKLHVGRNRLADTSNTKADELDKLIADVKKEISEIFTTASPKPVVTLSESHA